MNKLLKLFGFKIIRISNEYNLLGNIYKFPLKVDGTCIVDSNNKYTPFYFQYEEEAELIVNLFNQHCK